MNYQIYDKLDHIEQQLAAYGFLRIPHTPLFIWDPRAGVRGERRQALVQTIDLAPTLLDFFHQDIPEDMQGKSLYQTMVDDTRIREYALFGQHGVHVNITDGRYVYMRCPVPDKENELFNYILRQRAAPLRHPGNRERSGDEAHRGGRGRCV